KEEVEHAVEEGIDFRLLCNPTEILGHGEPKDPKYGSVRALRAVRMELGEPDESGRRSPVVIEGSEFELPVDTVIMAIGTSPNPLIKSTTEGLEVNRRGGIIIDEAGLTSRPGVYAGGDAVTGSATVISAMGAGKKAAEAIDRYIQNREE
ncbi:MAG: FAD-dependent oxidoreductase, partial [Solobacterium sp.]|nr:FAD-dependent oxidoreductase [Solobacterium sp.]